MTPEDRLKQQFVEIARPYFTLKPEVEGTHLADGYNVRIDYLALPRPNLVAQGFDNWWFGVEVKHLDSGTKKRNQLVAQAITYQKSVYHGAKYEIRPIFTLLYTNPLKDDSARMEFARLLSLAQYLNVGTFEITRYGWKIGFGSGVYFRYGSYNGTDELIKGNVANLGTKIYVGNAMNGRDLTTEKYIPEQFNVRTRLEISQ